jgi:hypothetical protein
LHPMERYIIALSSLYRVEQFDGWQQLHDSYVKGYPGATAMGFIQPKRIQVRLLKPDLALALTW